MLLPSCVLIWRFRQKPGCRKPTFMSVFYLDILGPIMASVLQRTILGRICLLISEEKRNHLPNISSTTIFWEEGRQRTWTYPSPGLWSPGLSQQESMFAMRTAMPCCPTSPQAALSEDCWGSAFKSWIRTHWAPWWTSSQSAPWKCLPRRHHLVF